jgi:flagellin-specific chaperone FliS
MISNYRQDKLLMETCIKHLTQYAAMIKTNQGAQSDESIGRLRKIIGEMEAYLGLSDRRAREEQFDKMLRRAVQTGRTNRVLEEQKIAAVNGLYRYASEMVSAQGAEAADRVKEVQAVIRELADDWDMDKEWADHLCSIIGSMSGYKVQSPSETREESRFFKDISAVAEKMGFEVKGVENGLLQLYLEGSRVAKVDESGSMLYRPNPNVFKLMDEIEAWKDREENLHMQDGFQM